MKWGIIATGTIAKKFASTVEQMGTEGEQLVAVGSRHMESAQAFAQQYDIPHLYNSYDALASDPEVEAVYFYSDYELAEWWGRTKVNRQNEKYGLDDTPIVIKGVIKGDTIAANCGVEVSHTEPGKGGFIVDSSKVAYESVNDIFMFFWEHQRVVAGHIL